MDTKTPDASLPWHLVEFQKLACPWQAPFADSLHLGMACHNQVHGPSKSILALKNRFLLFHIFLCHKFFSCKSLLGFDFRVCLVPSCQDCNLSIFQMFPLELFFIFIKIRPNPGTIQGSIPRFFPSFNPQMNSAKQHCTQKNCSWDYPNHTEYHDIQISWYDKKFLKLFQNNRVQFTLGFKIKWIVAYSLYVCDWTDVLGC